MLYKGQAKLWSAEVPLAVMETLELEQGGSALNEAVIVHGFWHLEVAAAVVRDLMRDGGQMTTSLERKLHTVVGDVRRRNGLDQGKRVTALRAGLEQVREALGWIPRAQAIASDGVEASLTLVGLRDDDSFRARGFRDRRFVETGTDWRAPSIALEVGRILAVQCLKRCPRVLNRISSRREDLTKVLSSDAARVRASSTARMLGFVLRMTVRELKREAEKAELTPDDQRLMKGSDFVVRWLTAEQLVLGPLELDFADYAAERSAGRVRRMYAEREFAALLRIAAAPHTRGGASGRGCFRA